MSLGVLVNPWRFGGVLMSLGVVVNSLALAGAKLALLFFGFLRGAEVFFNFMAIVRPDR